MEMATLLPGHARDDDDDVDDGDDISGPEHHPFIIFYLYLFVFGRIFQIYFLQFFGRSGRIRELVLLYRSPHPC